MSEWKQQRAVTIRNLDDSEDFERESDGWIWKQYSLFLLINRHCAEFMDDDTVSSALRKVREMVPLPYD